MFSKGVWKLVFLVGVVVLPGVLTAGPRVDFTGRWCARCCEAWCPYDGEGFYFGCFPDLDGTMCDYNDNHFLFVGGCN